MTWGYGFFVRYVAWWDCGLESLQVYTFDFSSIRQFFSLNFDQLIYNRSTELSDHLLFHKWKRPPKEASRFVLPIVGQTVVFTAIYFDLSDLSGMVQERKEKIIEKMHAQALHGFKMCIPSYAIGLNKKKFYI